MVRRTEYLQKLLSWKDEQVIKVVTGIRRCGKSTLLKQYQALLRDQGVGEEQILSINFEELEYEPLLEYHALYDYVKAHLCPDKMTYIFLDEVQKVEGFQKVVDSLYVKENTDLHHRLQCLSALRRSGHPAHGAVCGALHATAFVPRVLHDHGRPGRGGLC